MTANNPDVEQQTQPCTTSSFKSTQPFSTYPPNIFQRIMMAVFLFLVITPQITSGLYNDGSLTPYERKYLAQELCTPQFKQYYFDGLKGEHRVADQNQIFGEYLEGYCTLASSLGITGDVGDFLRCVTESRSICKEGLDAKDRVDISLSELAWLKDDQSDQYLEKDIPENLCPKLLEAKKMGEAACHIRNNIITGHCSSLLPHDYSDASHFLKCVRKVKQICGEKNNDPDLADPHWQNCGTRSKY
jgi:hypothetical protein